MNELISYLYYQHHCQHHCREQSKACSDTAGAARLGKSWFYTVDEKAGPRLQKQGKEPIGSEEERLGSF